MPACFIKIGDIMKHELCTKISIDSSFNFDALLKSYNHCRKGKRFRAATIKYHLDHLRNLKKLWKRLTSGKYTMGRLYSFIIYEPKKRYITATHFEDKIVQRILANVLRDCISPSLIHDNYASQPLKGTDLAIQRLQKHMRSFCKMQVHDDAGYVLTCDIKKFFYTIDKHIVCEMISKFNIDDAIKRLLYQQVYAYMPMMNEYTNDPNRGLCIGFEPSQWLAVYYLNGLDHFIKEKLHIKYYGRYMDDFYLIHHDKKYLKHCWKEIKRYVEDKLNLELNDKTHIHPLSQGVCFLGYRAQFNHSNNQIDISIQKKSVNNMLRRANKQAGLLEYGKISLEDCMKSLASWDSYATKYMSTEKIENAKQKVVNKLERIAKLLDDKHSNRSDPDKLQLFNDLYIDKNWEALMCISKHKSKKKFKQDSVMEIRKVGLFIDAMAQVSDE